MKLLSYPHSFFIGLFNRRLSPPVVGNQRLPSPVIASLVLSFPYALSDFSFSYFSSLFFIVFKINN